MSKNKNTLSLNIEIKKIDVDDRYFTIKYKYILDGKQKIGEIHEDYEGWENKEWKEILEEGEALRCALQDIAEDY